MTGNKLKKNKDFFKKIPPGLLPFIVGIIGSTIGILMILSGLQRKDVLAAKDLVEKIEILESRQEMIWRDLGDYHEEIRSIKKSIERITELPGETKTAVRLERVENDMRGAKSDLSFIKKVITKNVRDVISMTLLEMDISNFKKSTNTSLLSLDSRIGNNFNLMLVFMGSLVVILISGILTRASRIREERDS